jgi:hypothetical protein
MIFVFSAEPHASQDRICIGKYGLPLMIYLLFQIIHELAEANANILILMVLLYIIMGLFCQKPKQALFIFLIISY